MPTEAERLQFTPGPWHIVNRQGLRGIYDVVITGSDGSVYLAQHVGEANARLIAAAPNLLAALETLLLNYVAALTLAGAEPDQRSVFKARDAIAQARGSNV